MRQDTLCPKERCNLPERDSTISDQDTAFMSYQAAPFFDHQDIPKNLQHTDFLTIIC